MKRIFLCLICIFLCVTIHSQNSYSADKPKAKTKKELVMLLKQSEEKKTELTDQFSKLNEKYQDLQRFVNSSSCSAQAQKSEPVLEPVQNCHCENTQEKVCNDLKEQNNSLRDTIRAQNEYLLDVDNSGQISQKLISENTQYKSKVYYLEQATKSSADEIKKLMILNENLQKELIKYKGQ